MPSRAAHTKSRSGCTRCKQRRVKCDEGRPCKDCHRRSELCSLVNDPVYIAKFSNGRLHNAASPAGSASPGSGAYATTPSSHELGLFGSSQPQQRLDTSVISASDWAEDLYLITHWINYTSLTLTNRPGAPYVLKELGPEMGVKFPHVLHTMLALSAAHLAAKMPDKHKHYSTLAARHQQNASQQFQATIQDIRKDNVVAIFVTAALLSVNCLANLSHARNASGVHEPSLDDIVAVFSMTRGVRDILHPSWQWLRDADYAPMFGPLLDGYTLQSNETYKLPDDFEKRMQILRDDLIEDHTGYHDTSKEACQFALIGLERVLRDVVHLPAADGSEPVDFRTRKDLESGVLMKWTTMVSATYVGLVRRKHIAALVLLAHWVMVLRHMGDHWYLDGWKETAFALIIEGLEEKHRWWIEWPHEYAMMT